MSCEILKEVLLLFTCVFVSLHKTVKYVQYPYVLYILIASFQKNWIGLLETIFLSFLFVLLRRKMTIYSWILNSFGCSKFFRFTIECQGCKIIKTAFLNLVWRNWTNSSTKGWAHLLTRKEKEIPAQVMFPGNNHDCEAWHPGGIKVLLFEVIFKIVNVIRFLSVSVVRTCQKKNRIQL